MNKLYHYPLLVFFVGLGFMTQAQTDILFKGQLFTKTYNEPVIGAYVEVIGEYQHGVLSDINGDFSIEVKDDESDEFILTVEFLGYKSVTIPILRSDIEDNTWSINAIYLEETATKLNEVTISGAQSPYKGNFQGTNYYISPKVMKAIQPLASEEVLRTVPGLNVVGDMGLSNRPNISIRGSWGRRSEKVLMMEDGSPISPAPYIAPGIYYNPISDRVDAIEVYTGADILRYGPNNMYGIINYITPKPPQLPTLRAKVAGGQRGFFTGLVSYGGTWNKLGALVEGVYKRFDGFTQNSSVEMMNLNAKIFAELSETQSLYFKVSGQFENNQATLSAITPLTFELDPTQNPFDADRFTMHRYGLDMIHKYVPNSRFKLTSKIFASDFARDWWRQVNEVIPAAEAKAYLGEHIFNDRFSYLAGRTFGPDDMVRVGRLINGRESITDSRWHFTVTGIEETADYSWGEPTSSSHHIQANVKLHRETYKDMVLRADSSRWARSGQFIRDIAYELNSLSGYVRYQFESGNFSATPILRVETVSMNKVDRLEASLNPIPQQPDDGEIVNRYTVLLPGLTMNYRWGETNFFASAYQGYIAPSKNFAFLVERDGEIVNPEFAQEVNMAPELNVNIEFGVRGRLFTDRIQGQIAVFNNTVRNFYLAGWNEFFDKLGRINVRGLESAVRLDVLGNHFGHHKFFIQPNLSFMRSRVLSGEVRDRQLFSQVVHSRDTKEEFINRVNKRPQDYRIFALNDLNEEVLVEGPISIEDLERVTSTTFIFGEDNINDAEAPYTPNFSAFLSLQYQYRDIGIGVSWNYIGSQFTEFANFINESADGAVGKLDPFQTWDVNFNYTFTISGHPINVFFVAKNIQNRIFRMSRLNRANSGIFPGGFRQINLGFSVDL